MEKFDLKKRLVRSSKFAGFVFALVGWFMLVVVTLESLFHKDLTNLEEFTETGTFILGIKVFVVLLLITLMIGRKWINRLLKDNNWLKIVLKIIFIVGAIGWIIGLSTRSPIFFI
jgi:hypothetical protein